LTKQSTIVDKLKEENRRAEGEISELLKNKMNVGQKTEEANTMLKEVLELLAMQRRKVSELAENAEDAQLQVRVDLEEAFRKSLLGGK
jgi:uncharacterized membrane protein